MEPEEKKKDRNVVSVLSLAASAIALICFITGRTTLWDFLSPHSAPASVASALGASAVPASPVPASVLAARTEQMLSQASFFVHYGHLPGHGTDDYDADDTEDDRQKLVSDLETYVATAQDKPQEKGRLARAKALLSQLGKMRPPPSLIPN